jgi:hypothetical protein
MFTRKSVPYLFITACALVLSLIFPSAVYADDRTPPSEEATAAVSPNVDEVIPVGNSLIVDEPIVNDVATPESQESIADITQSLADTNTVLIDGKGDPIPLVSETAINFLTIPDPYIVRGGVTYRFLPLGGCVALSNCTESSTPIQTAINFSVDGETIHVDPGIYVEQLVINKSLTLAGGGATSTFITAPANLSSVDGAEAIVQITGTTTLAEIAGFTIQGPVTGLDYGIYVRGGASAYIHDNVIKDVSDNPFSGNQNGVAIQVGRNLLGQIGTAVIEDNDINGYQKNGITVSNTGSQAQIRRNNVTGAGPTTITAQNGIQVSDGATANISNNTVTGNYWTLNDSWTSTGILLYSAGSGVILDGNIVDSNQVNIYDQSSNNVLIRNNSILNSSEWDGVDLYQVNGAIVTNNLFSGSSYDGLWIGGATTANLTISNNQFVNNGNGTSAATDPAAGGIHVAGGNLSTMAISGNLFNGNKVGISNEAGSGTLNATGNWWGDASGPSDASPVPDTCGLTLNNPGGLGDKVSRCVLYENWLTSNPFVNPIVPVIPDGERGFIARPGRFGIAPSQALIPVTGGQIIEIECKESPFTLMVNEVDFVLTGLCGYSLEVNPVTAESLPAGLSSGENFLSGSDIALLKDGEVLNSLPNNSSILVSYPFVADDMCIAKHWDEVGKVWQESTCSILEDHTQTSVQPGVNILANK